MARASTRRRNEIVDTINAALEIVDDVAQDGDGELVRAVVAGFALKQISEGNDKDDREDEDEAPEEDEDEPDGEEEEPKPPRRSRGRSSSSKSSSGGGSSRAKK